MNALIPNTLTTSRMASMPTAMSGASIASVPEDDEENSLEASRQF